MVVPPLYKKQKTSPVFFVTEIMLSCVEDEFRFFRFQVHHLFSIFMSVTFQFVSVNIT